MGLMHDGSNIHHQALFAQTYLLLWDSAEAKIYKFDFQKLSRLGGEIS